MKKDKELYIICYDWMTTKYGLSGNEKLMYALIYGMTKNGEYITLSTSYLKSRMGITERGTMKVITALYDKGLIDKDYTFKKGVRVCQYKALLPDKIVPLNKVNPRKKFSDTPEKSSVIPLNKLGGYNNNILIDNNISSTTTNAHAKDKLLSEIDELKNDRIWIEPICMKHKINLSELDVLFDAFILECQCNAVTGHIDIADAKRHFNSWLRIYKSKENGTNSNSKQQENNKQPNGLPVGLTEGRWHKFQSWGKKNIPSIIDNITPCMFLDMQRESCFRTGIMAKVLCDMEKKPSTGELLQDFIVLCEGKYSEDIKKSIGLT